MHANRTVEYVIIAALVAAAFVLLDPLHWWMPTMLQMSALALLVAAFAALAAFLVREEARDEREAQIRSSSGRTGFLLGAGVLVAAIAAQAFMDMLDPWLIYALLAMVAGKVGARIYLERE